MLCAYCVLYDTLENAGQAPKLNIIYTEAYTALNRLLKKRRTVVQLEPPHGHRRNAVERAICTFNDHFVAGLASVDKKIQYTCGVGWYNKHKSRLIY